MIDTDRFVRFVLVDDVRETPHGLEASLHDERLRLELVRSDVLRVAMSRGGRFEESPTYAVCVDPLAEAVPFEVERSDGRARLVTEAMSRVAVARPVPARRAPRRRHAGGRDGRRRRRAATGRTRRLNDAFTLRRRCRPEDAIYGLGEKSGRHNRQGRDFTLWNTDVLDPDASAEFTARGPTGRPAGGPHEHRVRPVLRHRSRFFYHQTLPGRRDGRLLRRQRLPRRLRLHRRRASTAIHFAGGQYTEYVFAGPDMPDILDALHLADRAHGAAAAVGARLPPVPLVRLHPGRGRGSSAAGTATHDIPCDALWLDIEYMDGYRVFTWDTDTFPDAGRHARAPGASRASG